MGCSRLGLIPGCWILEILKLNSDLPESTIWPRTLQEPPCKQLHFHWLQLTTKKEWWVMIKWVPEVPTNKSGGFTTFVYSKGEWNLQVSFFLSRKLKFSHLYKLKDLPDLTHHTPVPTVVVIQICLLYSQCRLYSSQNIRGFYVIYFCSGDSRRVLYFWALGHDELNLFSQQYYLTTMWYLIQLSEAIWYYPNL